MFRTTLTFLLLLLAGTAPASRGTPEPTTPVTVVREYVRAQNNHELDKMAALLADSITISSGIAVREPGWKGTESRVSRAQQRAAIAKVVTKFPNLRFEIVAFLTEGEIVVTKEVFSGGTNHESEIALTIYRVHNGLISSLSVASPAALRGE